jgi:hypothetical protein
MLPCCAPHPTAGQAGGVSPGSACLMCEQRCCCCCCC